jgi:hypothetical protein
MANDIKSMDILWSEFIKSSKEFFGYEKKLRKLKKAQNEKRIKYNK